MQKYLLVLYYYNTAVMHYLLGTSSKGRFINIQTPLSDSNDGDLNDITESQLIRIGKRVSEALMLLLLLL